MQDPSPSVKRILTDDDRATAKFQSTDASDLAASIRAASMRARKSVTEGYLTSPPSLHLKQAPPSLPGLADYPLSARENNRQIFSSQSGVYSPLPSPSKRKVTHPDPLAHVHQDHSIIPFSIDSQSNLSPLSVTQLSGDVMDVDRPMKPLRRSRRIREVLPTRSSFPSQTEMNSHQCEQEFTNMPSAQPYSLESASDNEQH